MMTKIPPFYYSNSKRFKLLRLMVVTAVLLRHKKLLKMLLTTNDYVSVPSLAKELRCSEKTVRNDLKALDEWLKKYPLVTIERKPSVGVLLKGDDIYKKQVLRDLLNDSEEELSQDSRKLQLMKWLLTTDKMLTMQQMAEQFYVSKSTISDDLEEIDEWLSNFGLKLIRKPHLGLKIEGEEKAWRAALSRLIELLVDRSHYIWNENQLKMIEDVLQPYELALIEKEIRQTEKYLDFPLTDQAVVSLTVHIAIAVKRIKKGHGIRMDDSQLKELQTKKEYRLAEQLARRIEAWLVIKIPKEEIGYITLHLLGARVRYDQIQVKEGIGQFLSKVDQEALEIAKWLIEKTAKHTDDRLLEDEELLLGLTIHLHSALNRLRNGLSVTNPMLKEIKQMYRYAFEIVFSFIDEIENKIHLTIPEDEIAYIVLHIQAALERLQNQKHKRKRIVIVCSTGSGTSRLIEAKLSAAFPDLDIAGVASISRLNEVIVEKKPDVLISTVPLEKTNIPSITVSPLLPRHELEMLKEFLFRMNSHLQQADKRYETIKSLMNKDMIFLDLSLTDRFEIIEYLAKKLYEQGYVEREYGQSAKERETLSSTYIGGGIAIPHGEVSLIKKSAIAVAKLSDPIHWDGEEVNLVFMISNRFEENEKIKKLFQELADLSEDEEMIRKLASSKTIDEFYQCL
jgi:activator of the mannose operon (transcriptional antiterminator)